MDDIFRILGAVLLIVLILAILPLFVMLLWNWLMPYLFRLPEVSYWQAAGIFILCEILFWRPSGGKRG